MIKLDESKEETQKILEEWREEAGAMTLEELPAFLKKITEDYTHDYGTICHAISIGGVATMWAVNRTDQGGITGFQAGAVMWETIMNWDKSMRSKPLTLVDYSNMLYPQYQDKFEKTIAPNTWEYLQKEAKKNLDNTDLDMVSMAVSSHWVDIVNGKVPFGYTVKESD